MNSGIIFGTNNVHFVDNDGTNILEIAITINDNNINTINDGLIFATKLNKLTVTTVPTFVYLNKAINCDATNISNIISPSPFKLLEIFFIISLLDLICFVLTPYIIEHIIKINDEIYKNPFTNGEFALNNLFIYKVCYESSNKPDKGKLGITEYITIIAIIRKAIIDFLNPFLSNFSLTS